MTRKLHNTLMAVIASSSLLVVGLIVSAPIGPNTVPGTTAPSLASIDADEAELHAEAATIQADATPARAIRATRHDRQSLAMPFFSFAPRG